MSTHTPGPWTVDGPPNNQIVWSDAENRVCFLAHSNGRDDERDIATGKLIASAPTMLETLKRLRTPAPGVKRLPPWALGLIEVAIRRAESTGS